MKLVKPSFEILEQKPKEIVVPADMEIGTNNKISGDSASTVEIISDTKLSVTL